jgi:hypothetical protein
VSTRVRCGPRNLIQGNHSLEHTCTNQDIDRRGTHRRNVYSVSASPNLISVHNYNSSISAGNGNDNGGPRQCRRAGALVTPSRHCPSHIRLVSRRLLLPRRRQPTIKVSTWISGLALFELAVLDLKECTAESVDASRWQNVLQGANEKLDGAFLLLNGNADLSGRLDSLITMLRGEIVTNRTMVGGG